MAAFTTASVLRDMASESVTTNGHPLPDTSARQSISCGADPLQVGNTSSAGWIVQKFGGTSVGKFAINVADQIIRRSLDSHRVIVVCSARSALSKADGTTNRLLKAAKEAEKPASRGYEGIVKEIYEEHLKAAKEHIQDADLLSELNEQIVEEWRDLILLLEATQRVGEVSVRSQDKIIGKGEKLSCLFVTALLKDRGMDSQYVDLSEVISYRSHEPLEESFYKDLAKILAQEVQKCGNKIPVLTGFFGAVPGGLLNQIGRGYTDLCAALVAVGVQAEELQVWKEVDGIFTADPRKVPAAQLLSTITPAEAAELTFYGSEVIHPFTMEQVIRARIPIRIKNVMNPRGDGTVIFPDAPAETDQKSWTGHDRSLLHGRSASASSLANRHPKHPTAVTIKHQIIVINVNSNKRTLSHGFFAKIFSILDKWRLSIDLISTSEVHVSMALHSGFAQLERGIHHESEELDPDLQGALKELRSLGTVDVTSGMAILSLVGKEMKDMVGIAGRMFSILGGSEINIEMISQGASEINISCVIEEKEADRAINILHTHLFTFPD